MSTTCLKCDEVTGVMENICPACKEKLLNEKKVTKFFRFKPDDGLTIRVLKAIRSFLLLALYSALLGGVFGAFYGGAVFVKRLFAG